MTRHLLLLAGVAVLAGSSPAVAQVPLAPAALPAQTSSLSGYLQGLVTDDAGSAIAGASIVALGTTLAVARSDVAGHFNLVLPAGQYILRATREGYISNYREAIRVQSNLALQRTIRLLRYAPDSQPGSAAEPAVGAPPSELTWLLRHLDRTVLRDESPVPADTNDVLPDAPVWRSSKAHEPLPLFPIPDLTGQVNFVASSSLLSSSGRMPEAWTREIAYVAVGAPVGASGDWSVRAAMAPADTSSWTLLGEYNSHPGVHAAHVGVSYSSQAFVTSQTQPATLALQTPDSRSASGVSASDRWRVTPVLDLDYSGRLERFDYLARPTEPSGSVGVRLQVLSGTYLRVSAGDVAVAPGSDQFMPPTSGPWLPPERTFSSLTGDPLNVERVKTGEIAVERAVGRSQTVSVAVFNETTDNQLATIFGIDEDSALGHYDIAPVGGVSVTGWRVGIAGGLGRHVAGKVTYASARSEWTHLSDTPVLSGIVLPALPAGTGVVHELTAGLDIDVPESATAIAFAYRLSDAFARAAAGSPPETGGRVNLELRQKLLYQPVVGGELNLVFTLRTLLRDVDAGGLYDELLTVHPPMRVTGGVQVRF